MVTEFFIIALAYSFIYWYELLIQKNKDDIHHIVSHNNTANVPHRTTVVSGRTIQLFLIGQDAFYESPGVGISLSLRLRACGQTILMRITTDNLILTFIICLNISSLHKVRFPFKKYRQFQLILITLFSTFRVQPVRTSRFKNLNTFC